MSDGRRDHYGAPAFAHRAPAPALPALGIGVGAIGGLVYWLSALLWPSSVAVALAMFATSMLCLRVDPQSDAQDRRAALGIVFAVLVKYDVLMALTSAKLGIALPDNLVLGLVMVAGAAAGYALAAAARSSGGSLSGGALALTLIIGAAPALLLGIPGLIGLAAALLSRLAPSGLPRSTQSPDRVPRFDAMRQLAETCFLLGALAGWKYV